VKSRVNRARAAVLARLEQAGAAQSPRDRLKPSAATLESVLATYHFPNAA
jgi:hypothetical protein